MQVGFRECGGFLLFFIRFLNVLVFYPKKVAMVDLEVFGLIIRKHFRSEQ